jgi:hypothetical protein
MIVFRTLRCQKGKPRRNLRSYRDDVSVMIPLGNAQLRRRNIHVQTMAGRELPASVRAFRDHPIATMAPPRPTRLAQAR